MSKDSVALSQHAESWQAVWDAFKISQGDSNMTDAQRRETLIVFGDSHQLLAASGGFLLAAHKILELGKGQRGSRDEGDTTEDARDVRTLFLNAKC